MDNLNYTALEGDFLSNNVWRKMQYAQIFSGDGRYGKGHIDTFTKVGTTSLYDGHIILATGTGTTVAPIDSEADAPGIIRLTLDGDAANDEAVIQLGNGLDDGFIKLASTDVAFEARVRLSDVTAAKASWFVGLATGGAAGAAITDKMFADTTGALYATNSFVGFQHLQAESTALDAMYQASGETKVDGAVNTDLDTVHTVVADTWVKLGFRYFHHPRRLCWFVDGVEMCHIYNTALADDAFPDDVFLQPTIGAKDIAGNLEVLLDIDWWAVAQLA